MKLFYFVVILSLALIPILLQESLAEPVETCGYASCQDNNFSTYWSNTASYPGGVTWSIDSMVPENNQVHVKSSHGGASSRGHLYQYVQNSITGENYCIYPVVQSGSCTYTCSASSCANSATADTTVTVPMSFDKIYSGFSVTWQTGSETFYAYEADVTIFPDTTPPTITIPNDITVEATGTYTQINIGNATATDDRDSNPTITNDAPDSFPVSTTIVTWTATDDGNNQSTATQNILVQDTTPPTLTIPNDITAEATDEFTTVIIGTATATDLVDPEPIITNDAPDSFPVSTTIVTWTATDDSGNKFTSTQNISFFKLDHYAKDNIFYDYLRTNYNGTTDNIIFTASKQQDTFSIFCKHFTQSTEQWNNQTEIILYNATFLSKDTSYIRCYDESQNVILLQTIYKPYGVTSGFDMINESFGNDGLFGVPFPFLIVLIVASIWTGRNAQVGVIVTGATIGIMGLLGLFELSAEVWAMIVLLIAVGMFLGKKVF